MKRVFFVPEFPITVDGKRAEDAKEHLVYESNASDATFCEEYIDPVDPEWTWVKPQGWIELCQVCAHLAQVNALEIARRQAAYELGVDESEVF